MSGDVTAANIVTFWREAGPARWFKKDPAFDDEIRRRFLAAHEAAAAGTLSAWETSAEGTLALLILLDQFPRNMFRGDARAFATDPQILLMDEPFASVDEQTRVLLQEELLRIWETDRKTVGYIPHSIDEALVLSDRVLVMSARPGRIKAEIEVTLPRPRSVYELKSTPEFADLVARVWEPLCQEVLASFGSLAVAS